MAELGAAVMQQADVAALWLLEALVLTLPQSLLQTYIMVSTDVGIISPGSNYSFRLVEFVVFSILSSFHTFCLDPQWPFPLVCVCCLFPGPWCCTAEPAV